MEIIALAKPSDWEWRPNFYPDVQASRDAIDRIVGKYDLPRPQASSLSGTGMVVCGLNNCHTKHFIGFLILLKNGKETIIGQDCGAREFGTTWSEVHAVFRAAEHKQAVERAVQALLESRSSTITQAEALLPDCERAHAELSKIRRELQRFPGFWSQLVSVARQGGHVRGKLEDGGASKRSTGKDTLETKAIILECGLILDDTAAYPRALKFKILAWLKDELDDEIAAASGDLKALSSIARRSGELEEHLRAAADFYTRSVALLVPENLAQLSAIDTHLLSRTQRSGALTRALRRLQTQSDQTSRG